MTGSNTLGRVAQSVEQNQAEQFMAMSGMVDSPYSIAAEQFANTHSDQIILAAQEAMEDDGFESTTPMQASVTNRQSRHSDPDWKTRAESILEDPESVPLATEERIRGELEEREHHADRRAPGQKTLEDQVEVDIERMHRKNVSRTAREARAERESRVVDDSREMGENDPLADIDQALRENLQERAEELSSEFVEGASVGGFMRDVAARVAYLDEHATDALKRTIDDWQDSGRMYKRLGDIDPWGDDEDEDEESVADDLRAAMDEGSSLGEAVNEVTDGDWPDVGCPGWGELEDRDLIPPREPPRDVSSWEGDDFVKVRVEVDQLWDPDSDSQFQVGLVKPPEGSHESTQKMKFTIWTNSNPAWDTPDGEKRLREGDIVEIRGARVNAYHNGTMWTENLAADSDTQIRVEERGDGGSPDGSITLNASYEGNPEDVSQSYPHMIVSGAGAHLELGF